MHEYIRRKLRKRKKSQEITKRKKTNHIQNKQRRGKRATRKERDD